MKVTVTKQHEWVRLALKEDKNKKVSFTCSYRGEKASMVGVDKALVHPAFKKWHEYMENPSKLKCKTVGDVLDKLAKKAEKFDTIEAFLKDMGGK